jgi:spore maturation protein CgeB
VKVVVLGLSITSSWGNGHATNYRALQAAFSAAGHEVLFLERDVPWYASQRDLTGAPWGRIELYSSLPDLLGRFGPDLRRADLVVIGSYVPEGAEVADVVLSQAGGVTAFYDIDTPVTLSALADGRCGYLRADLICRFDLYLSFTGGPTLTRLEEDFGARRAVAFYCLVDPDLYRPMAVETRWDLGYLGTYSADRQPALDRLMVEAARRRRDLRFVVAGPQYPEGLDWPDNVERIEHLAPPEHAGFYSACRLTLNVTRADMISAGWSPSVRLFETAACEVPVVSDRWPGLESIFEPGEEIFVADGADDVLALLEPDRATDLRRTAAAARQRVLAEHTAAHRVGQLEDLVEQVLSAAGSRP